MPDLLCTHALASSSYAASPLAGIPGRPSATTATTIWAQVEISWPGPRLARRPSLHQATWPPQIGCFRLSSDNETITGIDRSQMSSIRASVEMEICFEIYWNPQNFLFPCHTVYCGYHKVICRLMQKFKRTTHDPANLIPGGVLKQLLVNDLSFKKILPTDLRKNLRRKKS